MPALRRQLKSKLKTHKHPSVLKAARREGAGGCPRAGHRCGQAEEESPGESQDPVRQRVFPMGLYRYRGGIAQPAGSHATVVTTLSSARREFCKRRRLGDCRNYLDDCLFCFTAILVTSGCSLLVGKRFAAYYSWGFCFFHSF